MKEFLSKFFLLGIAAMLCVSISGDAKGAKKYDKLVQVTTGKADTVELAGPVADVLVANPSVADVGTLRSNRLYVIGRSVGDTNILAYDDAGNQLGNITVRVRADDGNLQSTLREFFPNEKITAKTIKDNVILSGTVSSPAVSNQVRELASRFLVQGGQTIVDLMTVRGEQQVMIKVKVVEAKRSALRELGIETDFSPGGGNGLNTNDIGREEAVPFGLGKLLTDTDKPLSIVARALETNGILNTLAEPNLTAISGETAGFLAGGEYPVPGGLDAQGNVTISFKQFGVALNFTPTVLSRDRIALHLSTEVSEIDKSNTVNGVPGLSVRRAETTVELASGGTIMMAGLIKSGTLDNLNSMPGVKNLPILGELFKSKSFSRDESELLIIVTPYLVNSYAEPEAVVGKEPPTVIEKRLQGFTKSRAEPVEIEKSSARQVQPADDVNVRGLADAADLKKMYEDAQLAEAEKEAEVAAIANAAPQPVEKVVPSKVEAVEVVAAVEPAAPAPETLVQALAETEMPRQASSTALSQKFADNLRKAYGNRVPEKIKTETKFGYIVD